MNRSYYIYAVVAVLGLLLAPPPSPVHLSYATSGSMEPGISPGDAYIVVGVGTPAEGDIITFYSAQRSEYVTHRIVEETPEGYITQGDANPTTDQEAGLPPVTEDTVLGYVFTPGGGPLILPGAGPVIRGITTNPLVPAVLAVIAILQGVRSHGPKRATSRRVPSFGDLVRPVFLVGIFGSLTVLLLLGTSSVTFQYVAVTSEPSGPAQVAVGEDRDQTFTIDIGGAPVSTVFVESDDITIRNKTVTDGKLRLNATVHARTDPGPFVVTVRTYAYPSTLPQPVLDTLHTIHPAVAGIAAVGAAFVPLYLVYWLLFDSRVRVRSTTSRRLRRLFGGDR